MTKIMAIATTGTLPTGLLNGDIITINPNTENGMVVPNDIKISLDSKNLIPISIKTER